MYADCIGRHQDKYIWEKQLQSFFSENSIIVCRALSFRLEKEVLNCELYEFTDVVSKSPGVISELQHAEDEFRERMIPKGSCFKVN